MPTLLVTFVQAKYIMETFVHISNISAFTNSILTKLQRYLGISRTDSNCHDDICPGNICPDGICPYQEYLSCYWHDCYQTFGTPFRGLNFCGPNFFLNKTFLYQPTHHHHTNSISAIYLLLARFWPNFISQQYLSCYCYDFDLTFVNKIFFWQNFF